MHSFACLPHWGPLAWGTCADVVAVASIRCLACTLAMVHMYMASSVKHYCCMEAYGLRLHADVDMGQHQQPCVRSCAVSPGWLPGGGGRFQWLPAAGHCARLPQRRCTGSEHGSRHSDGLLHVLACMIITGAAASSCSSPFGISGGSLACMLLVTRRSGNHQGRLCSVSKDGWCVGRCNQIRSSGPGSTASKGHGPSVLSFFF